MKNREKNFDCVDMKNKVQEKILEDKKKYSSEKEYQKERLKELMNSSKWGQFIKDAKKVESEEGAA
jgi:hypothetical protein